MQLEDLTVNLRPRTPWEASDLGALMYRQWWVPVMRVWIAVYMPVALLLLLVCYRQPWLAVLILWWLKPIFDRFVLHVLSRAVFGAIPTAGATLAAWREILREGVWADLTYRRFSLRRSFHLPIAQLEGPSIKTVGERAAVLGQRVGAYAVGITIACMNFELVTLLALEGLVEFFTPQDPFGPSFDLYAWMQGAESRALVEPVDVLYYAAAVSLVEPLYVAQGFGLYLVRRTLLEGWDIEIGFRRIANRLGRFGASALACTTISIIAGTLAIPDAWSQPNTNRPDTTLHQARVEIAEVMRAPEFERYREVTRWHWKGTKEENKKLERNPWVSALGEVLAEVTRVAAWLIAIAGVCALLWYGRRTLLDGVVQSGSHYRPSPTLFGLDIRPEALPHDIPEAARAHLSKGELREVLSLLYRGTLSVLIHQQNMPLRTGDTESDAVRAARQVFSPTAHAFFVELVDDWQGSAYSPRTPTSDRIEQLIRDWEAHFSTRAGAQENDRPPALTEAAA